MDCTAVDHAAPPEHRYHASGSSARGRPRRAHVDPHLPLEQLMARLVREGLDRHHPARPPRGLRAAPAKGAEQTSAPKT